MRPSCRFEVLLRLAKVIAAPFGSGQLTVQAPGGHTVGLSHFLPFPPCRLCNRRCWLEPLLEAATTADGSVAPRPLSSLLSAEIVENLLAADGYSPDLIYQPAFPKKPNDWETIAMRDYLSRLPGYGARIALRRKLVLEALGDPSAVAQLLALEAFEKLADSDRVLPRADRTAGDIDRENRARGSVEPDHPRGSRGPAGPAGVGRIGQGRGAQLSHRCFQDVVVPSSPG